MTKRCLPYDEGGLAKPWHIDPVLINAMTPEREDIREAAVKMLRQTYWFFSGQSQWAPDWYEKLPTFSWPVYVGKDRFRWFGIVINARSIAGETLFMAWRRQLIAWIKHSG